MRILLVSALPPPAGGIAVWTERYLAYCRDKSIDVGLVNIALNGTRKDKINNKTRPLDEISRTRRIINDMRKKLGEVNPSVVHMNTSCGSFGIFRDLICVRAANKRHIPVVLHFHCNVESMVRGKARTWALRQMTSMASQVLVLNRASQKYVTPFAQKAPIVVPNFINSDFIAESHEIRDTIEEIVFVGHVQETKGSRELLKAAERFPKVHFVLIGPVADGISSLPCPPNVSMIGQKSTDEVRQYLLNADLFLFPSYTEGFSLSLMEAMATGLPAIVTDVGANQDMIENQGGIVIPARDSDAIVAAIENLQAQEVRSKMSAWSINKVRKNYLVENIMVRLITLYQTFD